MDDSSLQITLSLDNATDNNIASSSSVSGLGHENPQSDELVAHASLMRRITGRRVIKIACGPWFVPSLQIIHETNFSITIPVINGKSDAMVASPSVVTAPLMEKTAITTPHPSDEAVIKSLAVARPA